MKVIDFLKNAKVFYVATLEEDQPQVRPIGFVMEYKGKLTFYSDNRKKMYRQLQINPKMEICAIDDKLNTLRITCKARFITDLDSQKAALEEMPMLAKIGYKAGEGEFEIYTIEDVKLSLTSLNGETIDDIQL